MKKIIALGVLLVMCMGILVGCGSGKDTGLRAGFETDPSATDPVIKCALISEKSRLKVGEDLTVRFYYGLVSKLPFGDIPPTNVLTRIFMANEKINRLDEMCLIKDIDDFEIEDYPWQYNPNVDLFPVYETIVVPSDLFTDETGGVSFYIIVFANWAEDPNPNWTTSSYKSAAVGFYYRIKGEDIILYSNYNKFRKDTRR